MDKKVISITLWGNGTEKGKWIEWYEDIKEVMNSLGYKNTHIGIYFREGTDCCPERKRNIGQDKGWGDSIEFVLLFTSERISASCP